ncbi:urease accessory protein [Spiractinospora alimapuensis]|uniref:urease accessory protein UreF n=1 Tax=Spiractinospora alimapuensis TaxID=2820884 RepID=UPI001F265E92|nr:urease accessory UreF family protein [Spiractinospora alimapuensis]QVQ55144.1 urease accessory protein [Spiractinospora alimapuensis]
MTPDITALLLADGRLPIGGHAQSAGLEPALAAGLTVKDVPAYMRTRVRTVGLVEAAATVMARRAALDPPVRLDVVQNAVLARTPSEPLRAASGLLGRGLCRLATRWWPDHEAVAALTALGSGPQRPVALGVVAAVTGMSDEQVARVCLYDDAQTVASAALKLLPVDPADAAWWVLDLGPAIEETTLRATRPTTPAELPAATAPWIEQWSLDHERRTRRLFIA